VEPIIWLNVGFWVRVGGWDLGLRFGDEAGLWGSRS